MRPRSRSPPTARQTRGAPFDPAAAGAGLTELAPIQIRIVFDGGSLGNPGRGYGSYQITVGESEPRIERLQFGDRITNNEAEYLALIRALDDAAATLRAVNIDPKAAKVEVRGDSQLVLKQTTGEWKARLPHLQALRDRARGLVDAFGSVALTWHPRAHSVRVLGH
jgi:ribonuclease HI